MNDWDAMREELKRLTKAQLLQVARDEEIVLGSDRNWKSTTVERIVRERKHRAGDGTPHKRETPWRHYRIKRAW